MMGKIFKKSWFYILAVIFFIIVGCVYMSPALDGKVINTSDGVSAQSVNHETMKYHEDTGEYSWWIGSVFSGMPAYQIGGGHYVSSDWLRPINRLFLWGHRNVIAIVVIYCIGFFILLLSLKINKWLALVGALAIAFSSYFFIIIGANHHSKTSTLALMSVVVAGFYLIYHKKRALGAILAMICSATGIYPHPQMAYYMCFIIGFFFLAELYMHAKEKRMKDFGISTLIFAIAFGVGVGTGSAATLANMEYARETMRGGHSDLVKEKEAGNKTEGLDLDYATQWSYGIDESFTFLIPNFMGGSSNYGVGKDSGIHKTMIKNGVPRRTADDFCKSLPMYWGDQPFTAGPVYMGAIVCLLFVLALLIVRGPYKWALLAITILSVCLSWGHNWMGLTRFFFDYMPVYNKFRAVSSILIIAEITMPLLGFLALKRLTDAGSEGAGEGKTGEEKAREAKSLIQKPLFISAGITAGICLCFALFGSSIFGFTSANDARMFSQMPSWLSDAIVDERISMFVSDCWRSFFFIVLATAWIWCYIRFKMKIAVFALGLGVLIMADMWSVDKRFMNDSYFVSQRDFKNAFAMQDYEKQVLQDKDPHFRVLNLATNTFNDARTSYYLKSIGGYSAAKLRRYQDLIDQHISKMNMNVINMLNAKYIIVQDKNSGKVVPQRNPGAMGNAWYVDSLVIVNTANEESAALNKLDLNRTAVLDKEFADYTKTFVPGHDSTAMVHLTKYAPEYIEYETSATQPGTVVFSEIYYPYGWDAYIDGQYQEHYRVNYMLRALNVPAGQHHIRFEFRPQSVKIGDTLSLICIGLMYAAIFVVAFFGIRKLMKETSGKV